METNMKVNGYDSMMNRKGIMLMEISIQVNENKNK